MKTIPLPRIASVLDRLSTSPSASGRAPAFGVGRPESLLSPARPRRLGGRGSLRCAAALALPLLLLLLTAAVRAEDYTYTTNASQITITGYAGAGGAVSIPSTINGLPVTAIGSYAFWYCTSLTSVYFAGNAPTIVGTAAFGNANNATVYYLPGTTGWGATFAGRPAVLWNPTAQFAGPTNPFGFTITGPTNVVIVVEAATNLTSPVWMPVGTNTLTGGSSYFSDPQWTNHPACFYRFRSP